MVGLKFVGRSMNKFLKLSQFRFNTGSYKEKRYRRDIVYYRFKYRYAVS
jgi:hypothetical protein